MPQSSLWPLALEVKRALERCYLPALEQAAVDVGLEGPKQSVWSLMFAALALEPEPLSVARLRRRSPYTAPQAFYEQLAHATLNGVLASTDEGEYSLSERGRQVARHLAEAAYACMAALKPLAQSDLDRLAALLGQLVESSVNAPEPPGKRHLKLSRRINPGQGAAAMVKIDQYLADLSAYREDAHQAAWQHYGTDGQAWEALTLLWRGEAASLDDLYQKLARRGHARAAYAAALQDLVEREWVEKEAATYRLTERGRTLRAVAEDETNRYFCAPWACLGDDEVEELQDLLVRLRDRLGE